jgi:hypothetical protein
MKTRAKIASILIVVFAWLIALALVYILYFKLKTLF